ncbi:sperm-associated antigen 8 isoform X2 [Strix uralensis]|uniref:sperm-associated antigen 8 isoform X2 n=1 Tax=Strix uralensis TaxID=36305 RepID=UPI003DA79C9C
MCPGETPPCMFRSNILLPEVLREKLPCHRETLTATTEVPQEMSATAEVPQEMLSATAKLPAETPAEQHSQMVPRGSCLIHNWQEERATNHLDSIPGWEPGSEGFTYRHGHHGLLVHQLLSWPTDSSTTKDTYRLPHRALLLGRGQRKAMLESMLYQKYRKEMLEKICPQRMPMESVSTTHQDYHAGGCQFMPLPTTQPHNYCTEQPCSFWLEQAHRLPGVTSIRSGDSPFRRNAAFSTPITEYLEQPLPCVPLSSQLRPQKQ